MVTPLEVEKCHGDTSRSVMVTPALNKEQSREHIRAKSGETTEVPEVPQ
jgi:hypothetical protein